MALFAISTTHLALALVTGVLLGGLTTGAMAGFYALTPTLYQADVRTTGMGWAIGIGRFGAILSPIATGILVDHGWHPMQLYLAFTSSFLIAMLALAGISTPGGRWVRSREVTRALRAEPISVQETLNEPS
jgi:MFS family permease